MSEVGRLLSSFELKLHENVIKISVAKIFITSLTHLIPLLMSVRMVQDKLMNELSPQIKREQAHDTYHKQQ